MLDLFQPQCTSPALFGTDVQGTSGQDERRRASRLIDGHSNSFVVTAVSEDAT